MHSSFLKKIPVNVLLSIFSLGALCVGCQLLAPYKGPIAPTPDEWKGSYDAPDAGQTIIPINWKDEIPPHQVIPENDKNNPQASNPELSPSTYQVSSVNPEIPNSNLPAPAEPQEPCFEDVRRDLYNWWEIFNDPILNELEEQALNSSYTLWAALERVREARDIALINFAPLLPHLGFAPSFSRNGSLIQNPLPGLGNSTGNGMTSTSSSPVNPVTNAAANAAAAAVNSALSQIPRDFRFVQSRYLVPLNLDYEVDLWSKLNNSYYAALIRAQAASQAYLNVLLSLTADVASAYFQIRSLDTQQEVIQKNIRVRQRAVDINRSRYNAGLIVYLDVSRAELEVARARSDSDDIRRLRGLQENLLATLVGTPASVFSIEPQWILVPPPVVPRGLPSELLCRRPDIAEAERNLAAAYRDIGVAYANFFPSLSLNASFGFESPFAHQLFSWKSRFWEVGWNVFQTVFDAGRTEANWDYYKAIFSETMANYQQTVLSAFRDVEDALVDLRGFAEQSHDLGVAVKAAQLTLELAQMRYDRGLINYLDVVDAERQLLETEQNSVIVLGNRYTSTVRLIRALGGGWGPCETCMDSNLE